MELSQKQRNSLFLTGLGLAFTILVLPHCLPKPEVVQRVEPTVMQAPAPADTKSDFEEKQEQEWNAIFDPRSPDQIKAEIITAENQFAEAPNTENAVAVKALLSHLYDQYKETAQYERALAVMQRILQLDTSISTEAYWQDKNELALAYLKAGDDTQAKKTIDELFQHIPSKTSAQRQLNGVLEYLLQSDKPEEALALTYRIVRYDKEHEWPLFAGYQSFIRLAEEFEDSAMPTKAQEVFDLGLNVEVHRNQPWGQAQIMARYAGFQERRGLKEQAETMRHDAQLLEAKVSQGDRT